MELNLPAVTDDVKLQQLLSNLLHPDPSKRLSNFQEVKNSPWLAGVDWKAIEEKSGVLPFAPRQGRLSIDQEFL